MLELIDLIRRIKKCDEAINANASNILLKTTEELGELASELLKLKSVHMRKNEISSENIDEFLSEMLELDIPPEEKIEHIRDKIKRRSPDLDEIDMETADVVISSIGLPLFCGSTPERVASAIYKKIECFEQRVTSGQYHIPKRVDDV